MKTLRSKTKNLNHLNFLSYLMIAACLSIFICSCSKKEDKAPPPPIKEISDEIKDLIYFQGDEKAPVVLINAQSGPDILLSTIEVDYIVEHFDTTGMLIVNVHQAQSLDSNRVKDNVLTLEQAVDLNTESVETLNKVIKYFKDQNRTVYVLGASFGAFITQELIVKKGIDVADKYLIMIGRLDMNDVMWQGMAEGRFGYFENGITPILFPEVATEALDINLARISAGLGMNRYTQLLNTVNDLSNLTYVYGEQDLFVGGLTSSEIQFLESKNANIIKSSGGHDDTFIDFLPQGFQEAFGIE